MEVRIYTYGFTDECNIFVRTCGENSVNMRTFLMKIMNKALVKSEVCKYYILECFRTEYESNAKKRIKQRKCAK
jgi:hypothetical protein